MTKYYFPLCYRSTFVVLLGLKIMQKLVQEVPNPSLCKLVINSDFSDTLSIPKTGLIYVNLGACAKLLAFPPEVFRLAHYHRWAVSAVLHSSLVRAAELQCRQTCPSFNLKECGFCEAKGLLIFCRRTEFQSSMFCAYTGTHSFCI